MKQNYAILTSVSLQTLTGLLIVALLTNAGCDYGVTTDDSDPPAENDNLTSVTARYDTAEEFAQEVVRQLLPHSSEGISDMSDDGEKLGDLSDEALAEMEAIQRQAENLLEKNPCYPAEIALGQDCEDFVGIVKGDTDPEPSSDAYNLIDDSKRTLDDAIAFAKRVQGMEGVVALLESLDDDVPGSISILIKEMLYAFPHLQHMTQEEWNLFFMEHGAVNTQSIPCKWHCAYDFGLDLAVIGGEAVAMAAGCVAIAFVDGPVPLMDFLALACISGVYVSASAKALEASKVHDECRKACDKKIG